MKDIKDLSSAFGTRTKRKISEGSSAFQMSSFVAKDDALDSKIEDWKKIVIDFFEKARSVKSTRWFLDWLGWQREVHTGDAGFC